MLEPLKDLPPGIEGLKASGKVSKDDYDAVLEPMLERARRDNRRMRFLYEFGPQFEGFTPGGAWEDARMGLRFVRLFDGCAIVSDLGWLRDFTRVAGFLMPCPVRVFENQQREEAIRWLRSLPEAEAISHRMLSESGVLVVEVRSALRAQDFDALARTADQWIDTHGDLHGLVIHAREFPGWENVGSLLRHLRFVRDHRRKVHKVAVAADSKFASVVPRIAERVLRAEVKGFGYDALDAAIAWAGGAAAQRSASQTSAHAP